MNKMKKKWKEMLFIPNFLSFIMIVTVLLLCQNIKVNAATGQDFVNDARWKNGITWGDSQRPKLSGWSSSGCCAYVCDFAKYVYGHNSYMDGATYFSSVSEIREGDIIYTGDHYFAVLGRSGNSLYTAEGNMGGKVCVSDTRYKISGDLITYQSANGWASYGVKAGYHHSAYFNDTTSPVISDVQITEHTANGYTVKCKVTDNIGVTKVQFPTWKASGTSEGCTWYDGVIDGNTVTFTFSDATLEGDYITHIYAWDAAGNYVATTTEAYVDKTPPTISQVFVQGKNSKGYTVYCTVEDNVGVTNVKFPTWKASGTSDGCTWYDGVTNGNKATFTFKDAKEEGNYITHIYAYDASGNQSSVSVGDVYCCEDSIEPVVKKAEIVNMTDDEIIVHVEASDDKIIDDISFRTLLGFNDLIEPSIYQLRNKTTSVDVNEKVFSGDVTLKLADLNMDQTGEYCSIQVVASDGQNNGYLYTPIFKVPVWKTTEIEISVGENIDGFAIGKMIGSDMACYNCYYNEDEEVIRKQKDNSNIVFYAMNSGRESIYLLELSTGVIKCVTFNVVDKNVTKVSLNKISAELSIGDTLQLTAKVSPDNVANKNVTWSSSDGNIAAVDETGLVTAKAHGTAVITVETEDGNKTASCTLTVKKEPESVKLSSINAEKKQTVYNAGEELNLSDISVTAIYSDDTTKPIAFSDCTSNAEELDMGTAGDKKLTIRYTENNAEATYDIAIKVLEKGSEGDK
ncbi:MAG: GBS Bsp-like repeat-containing protein, partial [Lachnospiraceae bacterium]|nr:GBS Bsp-like repeat-containing protein [Lachnospiraceae bacterium]